MRTMPQHRGGKEHLPRGNALLHSPQYGIHTSELGS
jgi:hypothetical protein